MDWHSGQRWGLPHGDRVLSRQHGASMTSAQLSTPGPALPGHSSQPPPRGGPSPPGCGLSLQLRSQCVSADSPDPSPLAPHSSLPSLHVHRSSSLSCPFGFKKGWWALVSVLTGDLTEEGSFDRALKDGEEFTS